jgi:thymidylate synthase (FAD)
MTDDKPPVPDGATIVLPPYGYVKLRHSCANDLMVVDAARTSFDKRSSWIYRTPDGQVFEEYDDADDHVDELAAKQKLPYLERRNFEAQNAPKATLKPADAGLINYLVKSKHGSPCECNWMSFEIRAPIMVFREFHRHRIGWSYSEESARYVQLRPDFYIPDRDNIREQHGKPGHYTYERIEDDDKAEHVRSALAQQYGRAYGAYESLLAQGIAKEQARSVLPVAIYSRMIASCNARSLMNFLALRNAPTAMREIRVYAQAMEAIWAKLMPVTAGAFVANGRVAP